MLRYILDTRRLWDNEARKSIELPIRIGETIYCDLEECLLTNHADPNGSKLDMWKVTAYFPNETIVGYSLKVLGPPAKISNDHLLYDGRFNLSKNAQ